MLNQKELTIIRILFDNRHTYITSQEVASALEVSDRTARKYIHLVSDILAENGAHLEAKQGRGYKLFIGNEGKFQTFYRQKVFSVSSTRNMTAIQESEDRQYFILHRLLFVEKEVKVDDLSSELYVSRSTISNDLVEIRKILKPEQLELNSKAGKGIYISGEEQNKRHFIMNYFFMNHLEDNLYTFSMYADLLQGIDIEEIVFIVLDECQSSQLQLSDFIIYNTVLHIGLAIKRLKTGFQIVDSGIEISRKSKEYQTSLNIVHRLQDKMAIDFPEAEAIYIAIHLKNRSYTDKVFRKSAYNEDEIKEQLITVLREFDEATGFYFHEDANLINGLMMHFTPLLSRLQNGMKIQNPLLDEVKQKYAQLFSLTIEYLSKMPVLKNYIISESEWAYLTIHLTAAVERFFYSQKARVLVICATGLGSSQMLKIRLEHEFGSKFVIDSVIGYYELSKTRLDNIDLIVSSISLPEENFSVPIVRVSVFLGDEDIRKINHALSQSKGFQRMQNSILLLSQAEKNEAIALAEQSFSKELFVRFAKGTTKEEVIQELTKQVECLEKREMKEQLKEQLALRETFGSVAFSPYLAVPHPIEAVTKKAHIAVGIIPSGVAWDDEHPAVQLVLMSLPDKSGTFHIEKINQLFIPIIEEKEFCFSLVASQTFEEFMQLFLTKI